MSLSPQEPAHISLSISHMDRLCPVAKALSSPMRVRILALLSTRSMNVNELADALHMPVSSAALNIRKLEEAGLIHTEIQPGIRGAMKLCSSVVRSVGIALLPTDPSEDAAVSLSLPVGSYASARQIRGACGLASGQSRIGQADSPHTFYHPERSRASLLWFTSGELEYHFFPDQLPLSTVEWIEISAELSSCPPSSASAESDIFLRFNGRELGTFTFPDDHHARRGRLDPDWWADSRARYGLLVSWRISRHGVTFCGEPFSAVTLSDLLSGDPEYLSLGFGVHADAEHVGGLRLFGSVFGDHPQDIRIRIGCVS